MQSLYGCVHLKDPLEAGVLKDKLSPGYGVMSVDVHNSDKRRD